MEDNNRRIAKNTIMLYIRMLFSMIVSLYTSRVILATLGITDFGINNVVCGVTAMCSSLSVSMSSATSRFLTFALGEGNMKKLKDTFASALTIHVILAIGVFIICETVGIWLLETQLVIPPERMNAARIIFQFSTVSCFAGIAQVPFISAIVSHERMDVFAYFGIADVILKLVIVYFLTLANFDKLILYGFLFFCVSMGMMICYAIFDMKHFEECRIRFLKDKTYILPMLKFSGWDLYGNMSVMARTEGINVLQNMFWGPIVNASTGVANQVMSAILGFSNNFLSAIRPQIVKMYAQNEIKEMQKLAERGSKFSFYLLFFISFPCFLELPFVLDLWLVDVPDWAVPFTRLTILFNWNVTMFLPLMFIIHATGRMKRISFINGTLYLSVIPITWVLFKMGFSPNTPFVLNALFVLLGAGLSNLYSVKLYIPTFDAISYLKNAVGKALIAVLVGAILPLIVYSFMQSGWFSFFTVCIVCVFSMGTSIYLLGLNQVERVAMKDMLMTKFHLKRG